MELVVNEWLPEYFRPTATDEEKELLEVFLNKFYARRDTIFVRRPSEFARKIHRYAKDYQEYPKIYKNIYQFITSTLLDSDRTIFVDDDMNHELPKTTLDVLSRGNLASDTYLFEAAIHTDSLLIITTDEKLALQMKDDPIFKVRLLKDFLREY